MPQYDNLPIYREAYDLTVHIDVVVAGFSRYHKYSLGSELRSHSRLVLRLIIRANYGKTYRLKTLIDLRHQLEYYKVLSRLAHDAGAYKSPTQYLHIAQRITSIIRQNEGWLKQTASTQPPSDAQKNGGGRPM